VREGKTGQEEGSVDVLLVRRGQNHQTDSCNSWSSINGTYDLQDVVHLLQSRLGERYRHGVRNPSVVDQDADLNFGLSDQFRVGGECFRSRVREVDGDDGGLDQGRFGGCTV
jgi:hypothetical protein